jgi:hypothetical protein
MVGAAKESVHLLEGHFLSLGDEEPDKGGEEEVDSGEEIEGITVTMLAIIPLCHVA